MNYDFVPRNIWDEFSGEFWLPIETPEYGLLVFNDRLRFGPSIIIISSVLPRRKIAMCEIVTKYLYEKLKDELEKQSENTKLVK